jgi:hypothetical protein
MTWLLEPLSKTLFALNFMNENTSGTVERVGGANTHHKQFTLSRQILIYHKLIIVLDQILVVKLLID